MSDMDYNVYWNICKFCYKGVYGSKEFQEHLIPHHLQLLTSQCLETTPVVSLARLKSNTCTKCGFSTNNKLDYYKHMEDNHHHHPSECPIVQELFVNNKKLRNAAFPSATFFVSSLCRSTFFNAQTMKNHMIESHGANIPTYIKVLSQPPLLLDSDSANHERRGKFSCYLCHTKRQSWTGARFHVRICERERGINYPSN